MDDKSFIVLVICVVTSRLTPSCSKSTDENIFLTQSSSQSEKVHIVENQSVRIKFLIAARSCLRKYPRSWTA